MHVNYIRVNDFTAKNSEQEVFMKTPFSLLILHIMSTINI